MVLPFRVGVERRVHGKIARAAYAARVAARANRLSRAAVPNFGDPTHAQPLLGPEKVVNDVCEPSHARPLTSQQTNPVVAVPPSLILRAELKEAPRLYDDITEDGVTALQAVQRFRWENRHLRSLAETYGRVIDLLPQQRRDQVWATIVCQLAACFFADLCPTFYQAQLRSAELNLGYFSYVPRKGKHGWYRRAKWAGLLH